MLKRILTAGAALGLGLGLTAGALRAAGSWGLFSRSDLDQSSDYVKQVMKLVHENYVEAPAAAYPKLTQAALRSIVGSLDPHSEFMTADEFRDLENELNGDFCGIGVEVEVRDGRLVVIAPIAGSPGARAGILRGDEIVSVDGQALPKGLTLATAVKRLLGKPNTQVEVGLFRPGTRQHIDMTLVRQVIAVDSVQHVRMLDGRIGYVQVTEFSAHTGEEFLAAVNKLVGQGAVGLVIDLRNNPGGLLEAAVDVAEPFFAKGELVVYTKGRQPEDRQDFRAALDGVPLRLPLAVLINSGTASAAEIVTGALKDTHRAVIVGERSFGKGSVQTIFRLENGEGMRLTTAYYYTPAGVSINEKGITPQVPVVMTPEEDNKLRLQQAREDLSDPAAFKERFGFAPIADRQLDAALAVLRGVNLLVERTPQDLAPQAAEPAADQ